MNPLNPNLLRRLKETFGHVRITNVGEQMVVCHLPDWIHRNGRLKAEIVTWGETYYVNCPFCSDMKQRLGVNHHWAHEDEKTHDDMLQLVTCFNEGCVNTREAQKRLHARVFPRGKFGRTMTVELQPAMPVGDTAPVVQEFTLPDGIPLIDLPKKHPAIHYLQERRFEPDAIARRWGVTYCEQNNGDRPRFREGRVVVPVYAPRVLNLETDAEESESLRLVGWQARWVKRPQDERVPKYMSARGMKKNERLYGLPQALETDGPVIVVEGVTDVWRLDHNAVALFGKTISPTQIKLLRRYFRDRPIVVLLDADAVEESRKIAWGIHACLAGTQDSGPVVVGKLPTGRKDPGECECDEIWTAVNKALN